MAGVDPAAPWENCMTGIMDWESGDFRIVTTEGKKTVSGLVSDVFGIHDVGERRECWSVTHIPTGIKLIPGEGFLVVESAEHFVEKISRKADWKSVDPSNPPPNLVETVMDIWNEMIVDDSLRMGTVPTIDPPPRGSSGNPFKHVGRNDPCPCGSGKKYKKCCLR